MKLLLLSILVSALANADPDGDKNVEIQQVEVIEIPWQENLPQLGDIPPIEYAPPKQDAGPPQQEYGPPKQEYGPPQQEYGPPKPVYGPPPELTTTESGEATTTELPTITVISANSTINSTNSTNDTNSTRARLERDDSVDKGVYYIYHPTGALQRVVYATKDDAKNMEYSAQLKYQNVEPISGPIYTYDPETYLFTRINRK